MRQNKIFASISFKHFPSDLRAGVVVFLVAVPLCMGIALASEAPVMSGIIAGVVGGIVIGIFGGSALGVSGPAAGLVFTMLEAKKKFMGQLEGELPAGTKMTDALTAQLAVEAFQILLLAVLIAGAIQFILGVLRAGTIAYYFPSSVIKGMLAAIGILIILKQIPHGLGYDKDFEGNMNFNQQDGHTTFSELLHMLSGIQAGAVLIAVVGILIMLAWEIPGLKQRAFFKTVPAALVVVAVGIGMQLLYMEAIPSLALTSEHMVPIDGGGPSEWFSLPDFGAIGNPTVWVTALIIAAVASVESLLCAEATDKLDPEKRITPMNKELRAQGIGNMVAGLIGGLPITQVVVRSSANIQSGARTKLAAIIHGLLIALSVLLLPGVLALIPLAALASILIMVGYKLARPSLFVSMWKKGRSQFIPFVVTIPAILLTGLVEGIGIGMAVGLATILYRNYRLPYFLSIKRAEGGRKEIRMELSEVVSFLNKGQIVSTLRLIPTGSKLIIDASQSSAIDYDVMEAIEEFQENARQHDIEVEFIHQENGLGPAADTNKRMHETLKQLSDDKPQIFNA